MDWMPGAVLEAFLAPIALLALVGVGRRLLDML